MIRILSFFSFVYFSWLFLLSVQFLVTLFQFQVFSQRRQFWDMCLFCLYAIVGYNLAGLWISIQAFLLFVTLYNFSVFLFYTIPECFLVIQLCFWLGIMLFKKDSITVSKFTAWDVFIISFIIMLITSISLFQYITPILPTLINSYFILSKGILELKLVILGINYLYLLNFSRYDITMANWKIFGFNISLYLLATCFLLNANNLFLIFLALELQNFITYILISIYKTRTTTISSIFMYLVLNSILTIFFLFSLLILYGLLKTLVLSELQLLFTLLDPKLEIVSWLIYSLMINFCILFFKLASAPFHFWIKDIYAGISFSLLGFFIINTKFVLFFLLIKLIFIFASPVWEPYLQCFLFFGGFLSILLGSLLTFYQSTIKTFLICSSIPHTGYLLLGLLNYTNLFNLIAISSYLLNYLITLLILWGIFSFFVEQTCQIDITLTELNAYFKYFPGFSLIITLALLSLAGIPPLVGFFFKYQIVSAISSSSFSLVLILLILSLISCYYYLNIIKLLFIDTTHQFSFKVSYNYIKTESQYLSYILLFGIVLIGAIFYNTIFMFNSTLMLLVYG